MEQNDVTVTLCITWTRIVTIRAVTTVKYRFNGVSVSGSMSIAEMTLAAAQPLPRTPGQM